MLHQHIEKSLELKPVHKLSQAPTQWVLFNVIL